MTKTTWLVKMASVSSLSLSASCSFLPSHIHNADNAATAEALQADLNEYSSNAPQTYQTMLANIDHLAIEEDKVISDLAANRDQALITDLITRSPSWLVARATDKTGTCDSDPSLATRLGCLRAKVFNMSRKYLVDKGIISADIKSATALRASFREAYELAERNVTSWNASVALLSTAISKVPSAISNETNMSSAAAIDDLANLVQKQEIEFMDAAGKVQKETIASILKRDLGSGKFDLPTPPGIKLQILTLGLELADIRRRAAQLRLSELNTRAELYEDAYSDIQLADRLRSEAESVIGVADEVPVFQYLMRQSHDASVKYMEARKQSEAAEFDKFSQQYTGHILQMSAMLKGLRLLALADSIAARTDAGLELAEARLNHKASVTRSQLADEEWRSVLRSGVAGLVAYHRGGLTAEDAANIIRIAQTVALGVIAAGVN